MNSQRMYFGLLGIIGLLLIAIFIGAYEANKLLASHAQISLKAKSEALQQEQTSYEVAKANIKKYADLNQIAETVVPQDKSQAEAVREIVNIAGENGVALSSISFPPSSLGGGSLVAPPSASSSSTSSSASPTPTAGSKSTSADSSQNKLSQLVQVKGIPGVYQLAITVTSDPNKPVSYPHLISFLSALEHNRRTAQVTSINIEPAGGPSFLLFTITLNEYIKP